MNFGDPGNFGKWSPQKQYTFVRMYDKSHTQRKRTGDNNSGCLSVIVMVIAFSTLIIKMLMH